MPICEYPNCLEDEELIQCKRPDDNLIIYYCEKHYRLGETEGWIIIDGVED